jgi:phage-related protein
MVKKKTYLGLKKVREFVASLPENAQAEYENIINALEKDGFIIEPFAKKLEKNLFEMRIRKGTQVRVFYFYDEDDYIFGVHAFIKKTQKTPKQELKKARKIVSMIKTGEYNE